MPGRHTVAAKLTCPLIQLVKFKIPIAVNAWIGRPSVFICTHKTVYDLLPEAVGKIENIVGYAQFICYAPRVLYIVKRAAGMLTRDSDIFVAEQLHGHSDAVISLFLHKQRRHT